MSTLPGPQDIRSDEAGGLTKDIRLEETGTLQRYLNPSHSTHIPTMRVALATLYCLLSAMTVIGANILPMRAASRDEGAFWNYKAHLSTADGTLCIHLC